LLLFAVVLLDMIGFGIVIPILPFITPRLGGSEFDIAMIIATYAVCSQRWSDPLWGRLSDRIGRKPVLMLCTAGAALAYLLLAFAETLWMIYAARALAGLMAGNFPVASAMMADITPPTERAKGMGMIGAAFGLGLVIGPVLGGLLSGSPTAASCCPACSPAACRCWPCCRLAVPARVAPRRARTAGAFAGSLAGAARHAEPPADAAVLFCTRAAISAVTYLFPLWVYALLDWGRARWASSSAWSARSWR
jgi:DHA1 family tetracycline resistance protein-like MFS transporter